MTICDDSAKLALVEASERAALVKWSGLVAYKLRKQTRRRSDGRLLRRLDPTEITPIQLRELWFKQNGRCVLTGRKLIIRGGGHFLDSCSVDRIDQTGGYQLDNIRLVTYQVNCARLFGTDAELIDFCKRYLRNRRAQNV